MVRIVNLPDYVTVTIENLLCEGAPGERAQYYKYFNRSCLPYWFQLNNGCPYDCGSQSSRDRFRRDHREHVINAKTVSRFILRLSLIGSVVSGL